ncbi:MAG: DUF5060 domain-containing protein [Anaerolineae bacterium]|nr:DUF5060 domain-containing protein [Anaerolineae bacterium]
MMSCRTNVPVEVSFAFEPGCSRPDVTFESRAGRTWTVPSFTGSDGALRARFAAPAPGDYTYRVSYGTALLQQGDPAEAEAQFAAADEALVDYSGDHAQTYATQGIDELGALRPEFEQNGFASKVQCQTYYGRMAYFYEIRMTTGESFFEQQRDHYLALKAACE